MGPPVFCVPLSLPTLLKKWPSTIHQSIVFVSMASLLPLCSERTAFPHSSSPADWFSNESLGHQREMVQESRSSESFSAVHRPQPARELEMRSLVLRQATLHPPQSTHQESQEPVRLVSGVLLSGPYCSWFLSCKTT